IPEMLPRSPASPARPRRIVFVAYDGLSLMDLAGPLEAFIVANRHSPGSAGGAPHEYSLVSVPGGRLRTADRLPVITGALPLPRRKPIDTLIVPGACDVEDVTRNRRLIEWIRGRAGGCRRVCSVCVGTFLLAAARLLDHRRATTHWMHCSLLSRRHPNIRVEP